MGIQLQLHKAQVVGGHDAVGGAGGGNSDGGGGGVAALQAAHRLHLGPHERVHHAVAQVRHDLVV